VWKLIILPFLLLPISLHADIKNLSDGLLHNIQKKWGNDGEQRLLNLQKLVMDQSKLANTFKNAKELEKNWLLADNVFWNRVPFVSDIEHWDVDDYWATPIETLASNGGDCEDYSIGKYFTLKDLGVPTQKLRITYVRALKWNQPHMVLAYYPEQDAEPLILDNLTGELLPASKRPDLVPIYSFNDDDLWVEAGSTARTGKSSQIRLWRDLIDKMDKEKKL
jgi:predicted transglutaminase-like cysteine proteinase